MSSHDNQKPDGSSDIGQHSNWVVIAETISRVEAEFAVNGLRSYDIPAVLDASPGILGTAGLTMTAIYSGRTETFKVKVPVDYEEEALNIVKLFIGADNGGDGEDIDYEV